MKIYHQLAVLLLVVLASVNTVSALESFDGEEEDCPNLIKEREMEEEENRIAEELALKALEEAKNPYPEQCMHNYDACVAKIDEFIATIKSEQGKIKDRLAPTQKVADDMEQLKRKLSKSIAQLDQEAEEARKSAEMAKADLEPTKQRKLVAEQELASCSSDAESKIKAIEAELAALKAEASTFASARVIFDIDNIKAGAKGVLKKYGLVKDEL